MRLPKRLFKKTVEEEEEPKAPGRPRERKSKPIDPKWLVRGKIHNHKVASMLDI